MAQTKAQVETITVAASEVRAHWSELVNRVANGEIRVIIEKNGASVAALVSSKDNEQLQIVDYNRAAFLQALTDLREGFKGIPEDEIEREVAKALAEVREERRTEQRRSE